MKKILTMVLTICLAAGVFAGCKKENVETGGKVPTLVWYVPGDKQNDMPSVAEEINKITQNKIGAKVDIQFIDTGAYTERMNMNMASNAEYDLCFTGYINPYSNAAKKGGLLALDKYLEKMPALKAAVPDYGWNGAKVNGTIYAVPNLQIMALSRALTIQKSLADKYNLDPSTIKAAEDIEPFLEQIKQGEPDLYPFSTNWGVSTFTSYEGAAFINFISAVKEGPKKYKVMPMPEVEGYKKNIQRIRNWYEKGYIRKDIASVMDDSQGVKAGKYAVGVGVYKPGMEGESLASTGREIIAIPISKPKIDQGAGTTAMTGVGRNSKKPELALKLIELVNTDKGLFNLISFGIEDKHYKKVSENRIEYIGGDQSGYRLNAAWKFGNQFNAYILPGQDDDVWEKTRELNDNAEVSEFLGFMLNTDSIKSEISQCETVMGTYKVINNGSEDPSTYYDTFIKKLYDAGVQTICDEVQRQIDEFFATTQ